MTSGINTVTVTTNPVTVDVDNDSKISINVTEQVATIEIGTSGPQGPKGDNAVVSPSDISYVHIQSTPSNTWTINHGLSFYPNVVVIDSGGSQVEGDVQYTSATSIVVNFSGAFSGKAYLS